MPHFRPASDETLHLPQTRTYTGRLLAGTGQSHGKARDTFGFGLSPEEVFGELRGKYDGTVPDDEIRSIINWARGKKANPSGYETFSHRSSPLTHWETVTEAKATGAVEQFLRGFRCDEPDLSEASPWRPLEDPAFDSLPLLAGLFHRDELVNVTLRHGVGITMSRDDWMRRIRDQGTPSGNIGCFFRPNPVSGTPSGGSGGWTDADVVAHRFAVLESDLLPLRIGPTAPSHRRHHF
jgi:hypothetical protein